MSNLIAHRGLDNNKYKENTKEAIINTLKKDYIKGIEIDVRITKDNKIVIIHDSTINRVSDGIGLVKNMTLKKLKKFNFGTKENPSKISTLKDILKIVPNDKIILIEIKCFNEEFNFIKHFYNIIKNFEDKQIYLMSFNKSIIKKLKKLHANLKCGILVSKIINKNHLSENFDFLAISSYNIDEIPNYKKAIFIWAISNKKRFIELKKKMDNNTYYIVDYPSKYI